TSSSVRSPARRRKAASSWAGRAAPNRAIPPCRPSWPRLRSGSDFRRRRRRLLLEDELVAVARDHDRLPLLHVAAEDGLGQGIFQVVFDRAAEGTGAVLLVVALFDQELLGLRGEFERDLALDQAAGELGHLQLDDLDQVVAIERPEEDD